MSARPVCRHCIGSARRRNTVMPDHSSLRAQGRAAEEAASRLLETGGWKIVYRNFRTSRGEIDIIAERGNLLAFIEVKAANRMTCQDLAHAVSPRKRRTIIECSKHFLHLHRKYSTWHLRYDVMVMGAEQCMAHVEGAFAEHDEAT